MHIGGRHAGAVDQACLAVRADMHSMPKHHWLPFLV
jgi:hypothetical protein